MHDADGYDEARRLAVVDLRNAWLDLSESCFRVAETLTPTTLVSDTVHEMDRFANASQLLALALDRVFGSTPPARDPGRDWYTYVRDRNS